MVLLGTLSATVTGKAQQSKDNGSTDAFADLSGATLAGTATDDNKVMLLDVIQPREAYVRVRVTGGAEDTIDGILAVQYNGRELPVTQPAGVVGPTMVFSPNESA
jgi:hypothetical protein